MVLYAMNQSVFQIYKLIVYRDGITLGCPILPYLSFQESGIVN